MFGASKRPHAARAAAGLAFLALAAPVAFAGARSQGDDAASLEPTPAAWLAGESAELEAADAAAILALLGSGRAAVVEGDELVERPLTPGERRRLGDLLATGGPPPVMRAALGALDPAAEAAATLGAALDWLGRVGTAEDVGLAVRLATPPPAGPAEPSGGAGAARDGRVAAPVRLAFAGAVRAIAARRPAAAPALRHAFTEAPAGLLSSLVEAMGDVPSGEGLPHLAACLRQVPELDAFVLAEMSDVAGELPGRADESVLRHVRALLAAGDDAVRREAMRAAGALADYDALPRLIEALGSDDPNVVGSAHRALQRITGLPLPAAASRWRRWHGAELDWWNERARGLLSELREGAPAVVAEALREVSSHRLYRHELAAGVASTLSREEEDLVAMACAVLGHLGSRRVVPDLVRGLEHDSPKVREAAVRALRAITGVDGGPDPAAWADLARR